MTEFEKLMLEQMGNLTNSVGEMGSRLDKIEIRLDNMDSRLDKIETRLDKIEDDIEEIKEEAKITRYATNHNGEKLEEMFTYLQDAGIITVN